MALVCRKHLQQDRRSRSSGEYFDIFNYAETNNRAGEKARQVEALGPKPGDLSLVPWIQILKGDNSLL